MKIQDILQKAIEKKASDLHLKANTQPIVRVRGKLYLLDRSLPVLSNQMIGEMINLIMSEESKDIYKNQKNVDFGYYFPNIGRFRFCVFSQKGDIRVVARIIQDTIPSFEDLNLPPVLESIAQYKRGMVLITGATGSGKSTTAAALLNYMNRSYSYHILTLEDPIEYVMHDHLSCVSQREMNLDFDDKAKALKSALRQDPDVIFIGEIRDAESMSIALHGAESGHLVMSTLHTATATETIDRCLSFFEGHKQKNAKYSLINALKAVISQRLVPSVDGKMVPAIEVLVNNLRVKQALLDQQSSGEIHRIMEESNTTWGMQSFDQHLVQLYQGGKITQKEALKFATHPKNVQLSFDGFQTSENHTATSLIQKTSEEKEETGETILKIRKT